MTNFIKIFFASFISLVLSFSVFADDDQPTFIPVEGFGCNYAPGKDINDLMRVVDEWNEYVVDTIASFNTLAVKGFAFNLLTKYSDKGYRKNNLFYADPLYFFDYCKMNFSRNIALLHDYSLYEFTILVRKDK